MLLLYFQYLPKDIHIVAIDLPGHGDTYVPEAGEDISFEMFVSSIKEVR